MKSEEDAEWFSRLAEREALDLDTWIGKEWKGQGEANDRSRDQASQRSVVGSRACFTRTMTQKQRSVPCARRSRSPHDMLAKDDQTSNFSTRTKKRARLPYRAYNVRRLISSTVWDLWIL